MRVRDPVCGRSIDVAEVVAAEDDGGWTYFFCSTACHGRFKASRGRYAAGAAAEGKRRDERMPSGGRVEPNGRFRVTHWR